MEVKSNASFYTDLLWKKQTRSTLFRNQNIFNIAKIIAWFQYTSLSVYYKVTNIPRVYSKCIITAVASVDDDMNWTTVFISVVWQKAHE
jgi:hypothetical protein